MMTFDEVESWDSVMAKMESWPAQQRGKVPPAKPAAKPAEPLDIRAVGGFVQSSPRFVRGT